MNILRTHIYLRQAQQLMDIIVFTAGALLPLAFAPCYWYIFAFISPLLFLVGLQNCSNKRAIWRGWLFGFGFFAVGTSWVYISIHVYGHTAFLFAGLLTLLFIAGLALFFALQAYCWVKFFACKHWLGITFAFACCWTLQEILRTWLLTGFPWLLLGNSQTITWLKGYAPIISVYGVTFITAIVSGLLLNSLRGKKHFVISLVTIGILFFTGFILEQINWTKTIDEPINVSLIQGNIPQTIKWNANYLSLSLNRYRNLTQHNWHNSLIVWPEGAIPDLLRNQQSYFNKLNKQALKHHSAIITGVVLSNATGTLFYNAMISLGKASGIYLKRHLVPFGEYLPFRKLLKNLINFFNIPMSNFSSGPTKQPLLTLNNIKIAPFLCYEIAYLNLMLPDLPKANLLLTISDDSWFGNSWASEQQLQISQMRSLEAGREQIVVANNGLTALIDQKGDIIKRLPRNKTAVLNGIVQPMQGTTPLVTIGWKIELMVLLFITFIILSSRTINARNISSS